MRTQELGEPIPDRNNPFWELLDPSQGASSQRRHVPQRSFPHPSIHPFTQLSNNYLLIDTWQDLAGWVWRWGMSLDAPLWLSQGTSWRGVIANLTQRGLYGARKYTPYCTALVDQSWGRETLCGTQDVLGEQSLLSCLVLLFIVSSSDLENPALHSPHTFPQNLLVDAVWLGPWLLFT